MRTPQDRLLEIGCGGGLLLRAAAGSVAELTGLDHSETMVELARRNAPAARVVLGSAEDLPWPEGAFAAVAMSVVFMFLPDPVGVLEECRRVLTPAGRLAIFTTAPELRGTPAAPEPLASRCHFYNDAELAALLRSAGFTVPSVINDDGGQLVTGSA
jgi:ubiquinone/menaquinone biosynthesis C-methylase UbiE